MWTVWPALDVHVILHSELSRSKMASSVCSGSAQCLHCAACKLAPSGVQDLQHRGDGAVAIGNFEWQACAKAHAPPSAAAVPPQPQTGACHDAASGRSWQKRLGPINLLAELFAGRRVGHDEVGPIHNDDGGPAQRANDAVLQASVDGVCARLLAQRLHAPA